MLLHGQEIRQQLGRMKLVGQAVPYRNTGIFGKGFDHFLTMAAVLNTVIHPAQHAGGIFNGFFMADLAAAWPEISDAGTLIKCGNFERASCPGRVFFEDERDAFSSQMLDFNTVFFIGF